MLMTISINKTKFSHVVRSFSFKNYNIIILHLRQSLELIKWITFCKACMCIYQLTSVDPCISSPLHRTFIGHIHTKCLLWNLPPTMTYKPTLQIAETTTAWTMALLYCIVRCSNLKGCWYSLFLGKKAAGLSLPNSELWLHSLEYSRYNGECHLLARSCPLCATLFECLISVFPLYTLFCKTARLHLYLVGISLIWVLQTGLCLAVLSLQLFKAIMATVISLWTLIYNMYIYYTINIYIYNLSILSHILGLNHTIF